MSLARDNARIARMGALVVDTAQDLRDAVQNDLFNWTWSIPAR